MTLDAPGLDAPPGTPDQAPTAVLAARQRLTALADAPVAEHVEVFDEVHRLLQDALATLDEA
ncbi:MAG: hypothetical protein EPN99_07415 [Frankiales bacterium]|nr:MAG: hypothetical protein EPN99_07415 [Frankiales bacterium]